MRAPVPALIYRPTRIASATVLALLLLIVGGLGAWLTGYRLLTGAWPQRTVATLDAVGTVSFSSIAALITCRSTVAWPPQARGFSSRRYPRADGTSPF